MVNRDGWADFKRKERYKQNLGSVGLTLSDDLFMRGDGRRFGDGMSWQRIEYGNIYLAILSIARNTTSSNQAL